MSDIRASGTLKNMLDNGTTIRDALSEKIDNSFDWEATEVVIEIDTKTRKMTTIDNGVGMTKYGLKKAVTLNERSNASNEKQGKYGAGLKHALVVDTALKGRAQIISKQVGMEEVLSINVDFKECLDNDRYSNNANEASVAQDRLFREHVIGDQGTVIIE